MNEDDFLVPGQNDVGLAGNLLAVQPESVTETVQHGANDLLRLRVLVPHPRHLLATLLGE
jgi:hypothetical protein